MEIQNNLILRWLSRAFLGAGVVAMLLLNSCSDDPEPTNEEEVITTLTVTLVPVGGGTTVTMEFYDEDGDGPIDPVYTYSSGGDEAVLSLANYTASITLLNETESPAGNITEEIEEEADDHLFCFTSSSALDLEISYEDEDGEGLPIGLETLWAGFSSSGTVNIVLRHQPGVKTGYCPGSGNTDIDVTFNVTLQ